MASGGVTEEHFSDETFDFLCTMCKQDGRNIEAVKYCRDCCDYYCSKCIKVHDKVPALKRHKIIDKGQFKNESGKALQMVPTESCVRHGHKPVDTYCENHDTVGCPTCMTIEHRLCTDIFYVPEYIQNGDRKTNLQDIQKTFESVKKNLSERISLSEQTKQRTMDKKAESIKHIRQFRQEINEKLDELEKASIVEIGKVYAEMINNIEEAMRLITECKRNVDSAEDKLRAAGNNVSQAFVREKIARTVAMNAEKCLSEQKIEDKEQELRFAPDQNLFDLLNGLKGLGRIVNNGNRKTEVKLDFGKRQDGLLQTRSMKTCPLDDAPNVISCDIKSTCVLEDGTVIVADRNNKRLIRLDRTAHNVRDDYRLPNTPWQVCVINNEEVAVSNKQKEILFVSLGVKMKKIYAIKTDFDCYGLAYADGNLYISNHNSSLYIYSVSGKRLKQFTMNQSGMPLLFLTYFFPIQSLAVSKDGLKIYIADFTKGLIILNNYGKVIGKFNGPELDGACDVHVTSSGVVLVCGYKSKNVLQFGASGELIGEILRSNGDERYKTVCCNQEMTKMIVGRQACNEIEVYDISQ